jgi:putative hydrolase of the HAD superfamily
MKKVVCLDLDDTLIQTQENYEKINNRLISLLQKEVAISRDEIMKVLNDIDIKSIRTKRFSKDRFPTSWVETFRYFLGDKRFSEESIYREAENIFRTTFELHSDAKSFLNKLSNNKQMSVWIVTHGDFEVQMKRINDVALGWVDRIVISEHKNFELYQKLKSEISDTPIMIGNSIRHDIIPAIQAGFIAIHIQRERVWDYDVCNSIYDFPSFGNLEEVWSYMFIAT